MSRYAAWVESRSQLSASALSADEKGSRLEALVTDWETEQIVRWSSRPLVDLSKHLDDIELFLKRDLAEFDRVKLHVLLGELHAGSGNSKQALEHAKALRNLAAMERWAEAVIRSVGEKR